MMTCRSKFDFIVKSTVSLLPFYMSCAVYENQPCLYAPDPENKEEVINAALHYLKKDFNEDHRRVVENVFQAEDYATLKAMFCGRLKFGTTGIRAKMGPGYTQLNYVTVQQISQGLASYLLEIHGNDKCKTQGVVIGYDG